MEQAAIDDFFPDVLASRQVDSKIYGLPMEVEPMAFYYDKTAFSEPGLPRAMCRKPGTSCSTSPRS